MGIVYKDIKILGEKGSKRAHALFDSGASVSLLRKDIAERIARTVSLPKPIKLTLGDGEGTLIIRELAALEITIEGCNLSQPLYIAEKLGEEIIIGADMMQRWDIRLVPRKRKVLISKEATRLKLI